MPQTPRNRALLTPAPPSASQPQIKITTLLTSDVIHEFNELLEHDLPEAYEESNWFSMSFVTRVHATFVNLDADANSLLSKEEFANYDGGSLTSAAVDRVFQISRNYDHQLDYKAYLNFVLAVEYPLRRPSLKYLFRLLDVDQRGFLTTSSLHYFWRAMLVRRRGWWWRAMGCLLPRFFHPPCLIPLFGLFLYVYSLSASALPCRPLLLSPEPPADGGGRRPAAH